MPDSNPQATLPAPLDWRKFMWDLLLVLLSPLLLLYLLFRLAKGKSLAGFRERLGFLPPAARYRPGEPPVLWIHAVSAGEVAAVEPIIHELRLAEPHAKLVLSTVTPTGHHMALTRKLEIDALFYLPMDFPGLIEPALRKINPRVLVLAETELWPGLLATARQYGTKVCIVNGRISNKSFPRYRLFRPLTAWALSSVDLICAQSDLDAQRFVALGADPERVLTVGNSKFDESFSHVPPEEAAKWRQDLGFTQDQPVLFAASTHPREEEMVLRCYEQLRGTYPDLGLLIAPRHPERGDTVETLIGEFGYACLRRSRTRDQVLPPPALSAQAQVALLDTMGEQARVFSIATVVFLGGSLVPVGGHNFLQPMAFGKPVVFGPYMHNSRDLTEMVLREGAALQVASSEEACQVISRLLGSESERNLLGVRAQALLSRNTGAAQTMVSHVIDLLEGP